MNLFGNTLENRRSGLWLALAIVIIAAIAIRVSFIKTSLRVLQPSSDESIFALMAVSIREGERPLLFWAQPYLFPIESYVTAPFAHKLPPDARGARLPLLLMQQVAFLLQVALALLLFRRAVTRSIALALILFPSSYLLMVQALYSMPGYAFLMLGGYLILVIAALGEKLNLLPLAGLLIGLLGGVGYAVHPLILVFALPAALFVILQGLYQFQFWFTSLATGAGTLAGLAPYWLAKKTMPGAHDAVEGLVPLSKFWARFWEIALSTTWPDTLGWRLVPFPDEPALGQLPRIIASLAPFALLAFVVAGWLAVATGVVASKEDTWKHRLVGLRSVMWGGVVLNLVLFALSKRSNAESYRYLLPAASFLPFLMADLASRVRYITPAVIAITVSLVGINLYRSIQLHRLWTSPNLTAKYAPIPDLQPALDYMEFAGIRRAVASYGAAYRITWQSGRKIVACQPLNERFPKWPIPYYEDKVWSGQPLAYVLTERIRFLKPSVFERHLRTEGVAADTAPAGEFVVYHNFRYDPPDEPLTPEMITISCTPNDHHAYRLQDQRKDTFWSTGGEMKMGDAIYLRFADTQTVTRLALHYTGRGQDVPMSYQIHLEGAIAEPRIEAVRLAKFVLIDGMPRYGLPVQMIRFSPTAAKGITISVAEPRQKRPWSVAELQVFVAKTPSSAE